jgi:hypothetical protein
MATFGDLRLGGSAGWDSRIVNVPMYLEIARRQFTQQSVDRSIGHSAMQKRKTTRD